MKATHVSNFNELVDFTKNHLKVSSYTANSEVQKHFFPKYEQFVLFERASFTDNYDYPMGQTIAAFLDKYHIAECYVIGPKYQVIKPVQI